ncbi:uncharacterized protein DC041_0008345, partial [Schistosoma bovis]
ITGCIALSVGIYEITYSDYHFLRGKYDFGLFTGEFMVYILVLITGIPSFKQGSYMICSCGIIILISSPFGWAGILPRSRGISISVSSIVASNSIILF